MRLFIFLICLLIVAAVVGCTSSIRYTSGVKPPQQQQTSDSSFQTEEPIAIAPNAPTRVDITKMDQAITTYMAIPYKPGGTGKLGLDCSGFVYCVYRDYDGTRLPITVRSLYRLEDRVDYGDLAYGDLVFFNLHSRKVSHVGIYLGGGKFVHASESRGVAIDDITDDYYSTSYAGARRLK